MTEELHKVERMAANALHKAEIATINVQSHEKICAERYDNIKAQMQSIPEMYKAINEIRASLGTSSGMWTGVSRFGVVISVICGIVLILKFYTGH